MYVPFSGWELPNCAERYKERPYLWARVVFIRREASESEDLKLLEPGHDLGSVISVLTFNSGKKIKTHEHMQQTEQNRTK